jgi:hypothetical protein
VLVDDNKMKSDAIFEEVMELLRPFVIRLLGPIDRELTNNLMSGGCITDVVKQRIDRIDVDYDGECMLKLL